MISSLPPPWLVLPCVPNKTRDHEWNSWIQLFLCVSQWAQVFCHCGGMLTDNTLLVLGSDGIPYNCVTAVSSPRRKRPFCPSVVDGGTWGMPRSSLVRLWVWLLSHFTQGFHSSTDRHGTIGAAGSQECAVSICHPAILQKWETGSVILLMKRESSKGLFFIIFHSQCS